MSLIISCISNIRKNIGLLLLCDITEAQAILSSDGKYGWHIEGLYNFPPDNDIYAIKEISKYEYDKLKR